MATRFEEEEAEFKAQHDVRVKEKEVAFQFAHAAFVRERLQRQAEFTKNEQVLQNLFDLNEEQKLRCLRHNSANFQQQHWKRRRVYDAEYEGVVHRRHEMENELIGEYGWQSFEANGCTHIVEAPRSEEKYRSDRTFNAKDPVHQDTRPWAMWREGVYAEPKGSGPYPSNSGYFPTFQPAATN